MKYPITICTAVFVAAALSIEHACCLLGGVVVFNFKQLLKC